MTTRTALSMTGATANATGGDLDCAGDTGVVVVIDITAITGTTPTAVFTLQGKDPPTGKYYTILASAALSTVSTTVLRVYPGLTTTANLVANDVLPDTFRVICTLGGTTPAVTATVGASLIR
jgi:hypothetical protein